VLAPAAVWLASPCDYRGWPIEARCKEINSMKADNILATIGHTPHIRINRLFGDGPGLDQVRAQQPRRLDQGPHRAGHGRGRRAQRRAQARRHHHRADLGNTGIGLAMVAAVKGYKLVLVMPDSMSIERRRLMLAYGASFDLTPREKGMKGAIARARNWWPQTPGAWMPQQFENPANIDVHVRTTAEEIAADFPDGLDALITGVGTGGHLTGCAQVLKAKWPKLKVYAVEPTPAR
jgi:cysteine synthase A